MGVIQAAFVQIQDTSGNVLHRWQDHWETQGITWDGVVWAPQAFEWQGVSSGMLTGSQAQLKFPHTQKIEDALELARRYLHIITIRVFQFDEEDTGAPPAVMHFVRGVTGQAGGGSMNFGESLVLQLTPALAPVGAQFPPRIATTDLIGSGCIL